MSLEVNLSLQQTPKQPLSRTVVYGILFCVMSVSVFFGIFFYNTFLSGKVAELEVQERELGNEVKRLLTSDGAYVTISKKMSDIEEIIAQRPPVDMRLSYVFSQLPQEIKVSRIDATSDSIRVSLVTSDLARIHEFLQTDLAEISQSDPAIEKIDILSFERSDDGAEYIGTVLISYQIL